MLILNEYSSRQRIYNSEDDVIALIKTTAETATRLKTDYNNLLPNNNITEFQNCYIDSLVVDKIMEITKFIKKDEKEIY